MLRLPKIFNDMVFKDYEHIKMKTDGFGMRTQNKNKQIDFHEVS